MDTGTTTGRGSMCPAGACNLVTNSGCSAGQACYFLAPAMGEPGEPMCATSGTGGAGDACSSYMNCREGFDCNTNDGVCVAYCCNRQDTDCPTGQLCAISLVDDMGMDTGVGFCVTGTDCDPVTNEGCTGTEGCYPISTDGAMDCIEPIAMGMEGASCSAANGCVPGHGCFTPSGGSATCMKFCRTDDATTCGEGQTCSPIGYPGDQATLGVCNPPMM